MSEQHTPLDCTTETRAAVDENDAAADENDARKSIDKHILLTHTAALQVLPGQSWFCTRKVANDAWRLDPRNKRVKTIILYALCCFANQYRIRVHAVVVMANHIHIVFTDENGNRYVFLRQFFHFTARAINALHGRHGPFWATRRREDTLPIVTPHAMLGIIAYVICNPVHHGVVADHEDYAGAATTVENFRDGKDLRPYRPKFLTTPTPLPKRPRLRIRVPPGFEHLADDADGIETFIALLKERIDELEALVRQGADLLGWTFDGADDADTQLARYIERARAAAARPYRTRRRSASAPCVVAHDRGAAAAFYRRKLAWEARYILCVNAVRRGEKDVVFPAGTVQQHVRGGHAVEPAPRFVMPAYDAQVEAAAIADGRGLIPRVRARLGLAADSPAAVGLPTPAMQAACGTAAQWALALDDVSIEETGPHPALDGDDAGPQPAAVSRACVEGDGEAADENAGGRAVIDDDGGIERDGAAIGVDGGVEGDDAAIGEATHAVGERAVLEAVTAVNDDAAGAWGRAGSALNDAGLDDARAHPTSGRKVDGSEDDAVEREQFWSHELELGETAPREDGSRGAEEPSGDAGASPERADTAAVA